MTNFLAAKKSLIGKHALWSWLETFILTCLVLLVCHLLNPTNPFFLAANFPWPWLAAVIAVLKYGFGPGMLSAIVITLTITLSTSMDVLTQANYQNYLLSGLTLIIFCALFSSNWLRRIAHAEELRTYSEQRLNQLALSYHMLYLSHNYLEKSLITKPVTLRAVMSDLQKIVLTKQGKLNAEAAYRFLQLISQYCAANTAGIYLCEHKKLLTQPVAMIGSTEVLALDDPLINHCIKSTEICYVSINQFESSNKCRYLVAVPLCNHDDDLLGILVIKEMSFWALTHETLKVMSILTTYFVEEMLMAADITEFSHAYPDCPAQFAKEFKKLMALKNKLNIDSALVAVIVNKDLRSNNVIYHLKQQQRSLDCVWSMQMQDWDVLITLMPLTDAVGIQGYLARIENHLKMHLGFSLDQEKIKTRSLQLYTGEPLKVLNDFFTYIEKAK